MTHGIVKLSDLLGGVIITPPPMERQRSVPAVQVTPKPEAQKVVAIPTRTPINRQAAYAIAPNKDWLSAPPVELTKPPTHQEVKELEAQLRMARNERAEMADELNLLRVANRALRDENKKLGWKLAEADKARYRLNLELKEARAQLQQAAVVLKEL